MTAFTLQSHVLILEDEREIAEPYILALTKNGYKPVHIQSLKELKEIIPKQSFVGAYIDIRLDENDDENVDGLYAMDLIKKADEHTVCIVVTGHGNFDIVRDSLKKYHAYDVTKKEDTDFKSFIELLNKAISENTSSTTDKHDLMHCLSGQELFFPWEEKIVSSLQAKAGYDSVYKIIPSLFSKIFPILISDTSPILVPNTKEKYSSCYVWSRKLGKKVIVLFGDDNVIKNLIENKKILINDKEILIKSLLFQKTDANLVGAVADTADQTFDTTWSPFSCHHLIKKASNK